MEAGLQLAVGRDADAGAICAEGTAHRLDEPYGSRSARQAVELGDTACTDRLQLRHPVQDRLRR